jgi:hypothetical protein
MPSEPGSIAEAARALKTDYGHLLTGPVRVPASDVEARIEAARVRLVSGRHVGQLQLDVDPRP